MGACGCGHPWSCSCVPHASPAVDRAVLRTHYICYLGCYPVQRLHGRSVPSSGLARRRSQRPFAKTRFAWTCPVMLAHWPSNRVTSYTFSSCAFRILSCATRLQRHAILHTRCAPVVTGAEPVKYAYRKLCRWLSLMVTRRFADTVEPAFYVHPTILCTADAVSNRLAVITDPRGAVSPSGRRVGCADTDGPRSGSQHRFRKLWSRQVKTV